MRIYIVRHGIAEPRTGSDDAARALTPKGRTRVAEIARGLRDLKVRPNLILTSPFRRAQETAVLLARGLDNVQVAELPELAAGVAGPAEVRQALTNYGDLPELCLVGHQPDIGHLASYLLTGSDQGCELEFKKGGVACFEAAALEALHYNLLWLMPPRVLRQI